MHYHNLTITTESRLWSTHQNLKVIPSLGKKSSARVFTNALEQLDEE